MGMMGLVLLTPLVQRASAVSLSHAWGAGKTFIQSDIAPLLQPAEQREYLDLYPTKLAKNVLLAQYLFVGGAAVFFLVSVWLWQRKEAAFSAQYAVDPAVAFFSKRGDRSAIHTVDIETAATVMDTSLDGITGQGPIGLLESEAATRLRTFGVNTLTPPARENRFLLLLKQVFGGLFNIMLWMCVAAELFLAVYFGGDDFVTPIVLSVVIVSSGMLQWWTELQAMMMMESLQAMSASPQVRVYRGDPTFVDADSLVPGDIISLEAGDKVPADVRIVKCTEGAEVDNAALTGESVPEARQVMPDGLTSPMLEARSMMFLGTTMVKGRVFAIVVYTGDSTALGNIAQSINKSRARSSLELQIEHFVHLIAGVAMAVGILSCLANIFSPQKRSWAHILENSATAFFAQVPEGLLPTVTISLMIAARKMTKRQVLVRKIDAVETLGCVAVLCSDKTGTLTTGQMTLTDTVPLPSFERQDFRLPATASRNLAECGILNNAANGTIGSPTEVAILTGMSKHLAEAGEAADVDSLRKTFPMVYEVPFNSENKWALTIHLVEKGPEHSTYRMIMKGAPERVYPFCHGDNTEADEVCATLMRQGRRVLGFCMREFDLPTGFVFCGASADDTNFKLGDMDFVGLVGLEDPPKPGVLGAIKAIQSAGVRPVMVTGDHPTTAQAIAERIGISVDGDENSCITGPVMSTMLPAGDFFNDAEDPLSVQEFWKEVVEHATIFARVSPSHKRIIVQAYQHYGKYITAMTGDGVNDAPALKQAEVGVAMGIRGTEVAKEAADIVLLDDNLESVVAGIEQGRLCSENLRKSILYTLCSKLPQVMPTFAELIGVPTALNVAQVLLIDIGTDIWTAIAFAWQPPESKLMAVPPRDPRTERMVTGKVLAYSYGYIGVLQMVVCFFVFFHAVPHMWTMFESYEFKHVSQHAFSDAEENYRGMTAYYWTLVLGQVAAAMATTTTRESLFTYGLPNMMLNICIVFEIVFAVLVIYWKPAENTFKFRALDVTQAAWGMLGFGIIFMFEEVRKKLAAAKERQDKTWR